MLGTSNIKLVGRPSDLVLSKDKTALGLTQEAGLATETMGKTNATAADLFNISRDPQSSMQRQAQAHFLERLIAAKTARGETDSVAVGIARYDGEELLGREDEDLPGKQTPDEHIDAEVSDRQGTMVRGRKGRATSRATPRAAGRTRLGYTIVRPKKYRLSGFDRRREIGGFFRDYKPSLGDLEGAETVRPTDSISTPRNWNDQEGFTGATSPNNDATPKSPALIDGPSPSQAI